MKAINPFVKPETSFKTTFAKIIAQGAVKTKFLKFNPGDFLFHEGDIISNTFYLKRGLVKLYSSTSEGHIKTIFFYTSGALIGFHGFRVSVNNIPILNAQASSKVEAYMLEERCFKEYLKTHGNVCYVISQYLLELAELQTREAVNASVYSVLQRFSALLLILCDEFSSERTPAILPFSNKDFAEMLGVHINSIANAIITLRNADCIERQYGAVAITDLEKLKTIAGSLIA